MNESQWVEFNPEELESGLYWVFGYQEEIDGDVDMDDYGNNTASYTGRLETVKSIAYIEIYNDGGFYIGKIDRMFNIMDIDNFNEGEFIPSFVIPITIPLTDPQ